MGILYDSVAQTRNESICVACGAYIPAQGSQLCPECEKLIPEDENDNLIGE